MFLSLSNPIFQHNRKISSHDVPEQIRERSMIWSAKLRVSNAIFCLALPEQKGYQKLSILSAIMYVREKRTKEIQIS